MHSGPTPAAVAAILLLGSVTARAQEPEPGEDGQPELALLVGDQEGVPRSEESPSAEPSTEEPPAEYLFFDEITVDQFTIVVRLVDSRGAPIVGLGPGDLIVRVGKKEVQVVALDWHSSAADLRGELGPGDAAVDADLPTDLGELRPLGEPDAGEPTGKLVVVFLQIGHHMAVTLDETYIGGHLKLLPHLRRLVHGLHPGDRVAVLSFDARLKLWHDFTRDREAISETLYRAIGFGTPAPDRSPELSLMDHFDFEAARAANTTEEALVVLGAALGPLPGVKDLIFVGWGLGRYIQGVSVTMPKSYLKAIRALRAAQATVFVLDTTQSEYHALAAGLENIAADTGGTYASSYDFASRKVDQLARTLAGHYVLTIDRSAFPDARGKLRVELRERQGEVLVRPYFVR